MEKMALKGRWMWGFGLIGGEGEGEGEGGVHLSLGEWGG